MIGNIRRYSVAGHQLTRHTLHHTLHIKSVIYSLSFLCLLVSTQLIAGTDWNNAEIDWKTYEEGMLQAAKDKRPVMLVFHSEGCGACADYSKLFHEPAVVEASHGLLMIIMDDGEDEEVSTRFAEDGSYVPRTYFLSAKGDVLPVRIGRPDTRFQYYLGPQGPEVLADFMLKAQQVAAE